MSSLLLPALQVSIYPGIVLEEVRARLVPRGRGGVLPEHARVLGMRDIKFIGVSVSHCEIVKAVKWWWSSANALASRRDAPHAS